MTERTTITTNSVDVAEVANMLRTAPLGNATREAAANHFAKRLKLTSEDAASFVRRALGQAPEITTI